jgi:hypothetical protein
MVLLNFNEQLVVSALHTQFNRHLVAGQRVYAFGRIHSHPETTSHPTPYQPSKFNADKKIEMRSHSIIQCSGTGHTKAANWVVFLQESVP